MAQPNVPDLSRVANRLRGAQALPFLTLSAAQKAMSTAIAVRLHRRRGKVRHRMNCATEDAEAVKVDPVAEDRTAEIVGLAVPARATAPEKASNWRVAKTGSRTSSAAKSAEACKHNLAGGRVLEKWK